MLLSRPPISHLPLSKREGETHQQTLPNFSDKCPKEDKSHNVEAWKKLRDPQRSHFRDEETEAQREEVLQGAGGRLEARACEGRGVLGCVTPVGGLPCGKKIPLKLLGNQPSTLERHAPPEANPGL